MENWLAELQRGRPEAAWDEFISRYRRLIFAAIRHYAQDYDDVMDVFAQVCEGLREHQLRRLRSWADLPDHRSRFSTWLVVVVRNLTVDWFRHRDGRRRVSAVAASLPPLQRRLFELIFLDRRSHAEACELVRSIEPGLTLREFHQALRATYRAVTEGRRGHLFRELGEPMPEPEEPAPADDAIGRWEQLEAALRSLSAEDRAAVELHIMLGVPAADVARTLGLPNAKAVYNRAYRALATLREWLARAGVGRGDL